MALSLADEFGSFTATVETPAPETEQGTDPIEQPEVQVEEEKVLEQPETGAQEIDADDYSTALKDYADSLGFTGEIEGEGLEALKFIANKSIEPYKEKAEAFDKIPVLGDLVKHLELGGSLEDFITTPQESNIYQDVELTDDSAPELLEEIFRRGNPTVNAKRVQQMIDFAKEDGTFAKEAGEILEGLKQQELEQNQGIKAARDQEYIQAVEANKVFLAEVAQTFTPTGLTGITTDKSIIDKAKANSLPDAKGVIGIHDLFNKFTPAQQAQMNIFAVALSEKKAFAFNPTRATNLPNAKSPMSALLGTGKGSPNGTKDKPLTDLGEIDALLAGRKR